MHGTGWCSAHYRSGDAERKPPNSTRIEQEVSSQWSGAASSGAVALVQDGRVARAKHTPLESEESAMSESENTAIVESIYAAFGRGDVPAILDSLADKFEWHHHGPIEDIPWAKSRHTKDEIVEFFQVLDKTVEFEKFEPRQFVAQGDTVVALGWWRAKGKATGRVIEEYWAMEWKLANGKVTFYRAYDDTAVIASALKA